MNQSEQINEIASALSKFQGKVSLIAKKKTANVTMKSGGKYSYNYADLPSILDAIRLNLSEHGLAVMHQFKGNLLITKLIHSSGQWIDSEMVLEFHDPDPQKRGALITFFRRYALTAILGISADEDDDAEMIVKDKNEYKKEVKKEAIFDAGKGLHEIKAYIAERKLDGNYLMDYIDKLAHEKNKPANEIIKAALMPEMQDKFSELYANFIAK